VNAGTPASNLQIYPDDTHADVLQKIIYNAGRANVAQAWVGGRLVHEL
jgi:guanine deaminase